VSQRRAIAGAKTGPWAGHGVVPQVVEEAHLFAG